MAIHASTPHTKLRSLGTTESFFWLANQFHPVHFVMAAHVIGKTSIQQWTYALSQISIRHRLLTSCIDVDNQGILSYWETQASIPIRVVTQGSTDSWKAEVQAELMTPFEGKSTLLSRAVLIHDVDEAVFILSTHHAIADGRSVVFVMEDLLKALTGERLNASTIISSLDNLLGMQPYLFKPDIVQAGISAEAVALLSSPQIDTQFFNEEETARLITQARQEGASVRVHS